MEGDTVAVTPAALLPSFQSTPSAWRETLDSIPILYTSFPFQSTPSAWRETPGADLGRKNSRYFNPLPPHGGRHSSRNASSLAAIISIHSLRMEGDLIDSTSQTKIRRFQSTPSAWRETTPVNQFIRYQTFQSTPSAWRETTSESSESESPNISIHSLRMEGDLFGSLRSTAAPVFQSTPSAWRETVYNTQASLEDAFQSTPSAWRETRGSPGIPVPHWNFNPLPPHGGRLNSIRGQLISTIFQSTPSAWRETLLAVRIFQHQCISIHSLRMEGDFTLRIRQIGFYISIHSLRMEGDARFSGRFSIIPISIHSLRMEGDMHVFFDALFQCISIHSLRMEGDRSWRKNTSKHQLISIHSLRMEGDISDCSKSSTSIISIHSLRMEGD